MLSYIIKFFGFIAWHFANIVAVAATVFSIYWLYAYAYEFTFKEVMIIVFNIIFIWISAFMYRIMMLLREVQKLKYK